MKMKTTLLALATVLALATLNHPVARAAEGDKAVEAILTRYVEALGGRATLEKQTTRVLKATFEGFGLPAAADWTMLAKAPNKQLSRLDLTGMGEILDGFDGQVGWSKNPFAGLRVKEGAELAKLRRDADFYRELRLPTIYTNLMVKGTEKVDGADATVLEAKPTADAIERFYFDAKSGLLVRQDSEFEMPEGRFKLQAFFSDYRAVDGIKYAHAMRFSLAMPEQPGTEFNIKVKEIKHQEAIDDARFAKPSA